MRKFGEDANRLALALDHAEAGSDLEREIIHSFLERFAAAQALDEARQWRENSHAATIEQAKWQHERIAQLEAERQGKGESLR